MKKRENRKARNESTSEEEEEYLTSHFIKISFRHHEKTMSLSDSDQLRSFHVKVTSKH